MKTDTDAAPLYVRVQTAIREAIQNGRLAAGSLLPSEKELEIEYGVSRITVRRALEELQREGLVVRGQGRQARVAEALVSVAQAKIEEDLAATLDLVRGTDSEVLSFDWKLADERIRSKLEIAPNEPVLRVDRVRSSNGRAIMHTCAHIPAFIGAKLSRETLTERSMLDILIKSGVTISSAEQVMHAAPCPAHIAPLIGLSPGDAVFLIERLVKDDKGRPIQHLIATFRWDCFSYRISSTRSEAGRVVEIAGAGSMAFLGNSRGQ
jgi:GntR family transcriptional regulator